MRCTAAQTVFVRTNKNYIYRSGDEGKTWEKQNWKMEGSQTEEDGKTGVLSMHVAPTDTNKVRRRARVMARAAAPTRAHEARPARKHSVPQDRSHPLSRAATQIFFRGAGKQHWITADEGSKYQPLTESFTIKELKMHPTEPEWMLASHLSDGCKKADRVNCQMEVRPLARPLCAPAVRHRARLNGATLLPAVCADPLTALMQPRRISAGPRRLSASSRLAP